jgi:hypothetical protein
MVSFSCEVSRILYKALTCFVAMRIREKDADHYDRPVVMSSPRKSSTLIAANVAALPSPVSIAWYISMEPSIELTRYVGVLPHNVLGLVGLGSQLIQVKGGTG